MSGPWDKYKTDEAGPWAKYQGQEDQQSQGQEAAPPERGIVGRAWDALNVPSQMSKSGLEQISEAVKPDPEITGNLPRDIAMNVPSVTANVLSKVAPGFIDRTSLLLSGGANLAKGLGPLANAAGRGLASQAEQITGAKPGAIRAAFNDASTMFSKGRKTVGKGYDAIEEEGLNLGQQLEASPIFAGPPKSNLQIVRQASKSAAKGTLSSGEAFEARKAADALKGSKSVNQTQLLKNRQSFDQLAKTDEAIAETDPAFRKAVFGESLRNIFPQNKHGGASAFKAGIIAALEQMGILGKVAGAAMSPAASGAAATVGGIASRAIAPIITNPAATLTTRQVIDQLLRRGANNGQ